MTGAPLMRFVNRISAALVISVSGVSVMRSVVMIWLTVIMRTSPSINPEHGQVILGLTFPGR